MSTPLLEPRITSLPKLHSGKVRDLYALGPDHLLIVTSDRLSAFDVILPDPIPGKGAVLNALTAFWMARFADVIPNHLDPGIDLADWLTADERAQCEGRAVVAKKLQALPVEAVARGYLIGSGWKDYRASGAVCGIPLPPGLMLADALPEPLYTPAFKAPKGEHDANISFEETVRLIGAERAAQVREITLHLYREAAAFAATRGILIADTKFEFGVDAEGRLHLIDEVLTPDSSRFWPAAQYQPGISPPSFDKQIVRDWLEAQPWNKTAPGPALPAGIIDQTARSYRDAQRLLTGA